jgi:hypothetical protein
MATIIHTPYVGQAVYKTCAPLDAGKIVSVIGKETNGFFYSVVVKWLKTEETTITTTAGLRDLVALKDDAQRKWSTHNDTLAKVYAL